MSGKKLHFGIIGAGRIGKVHAETLAFRLPEAEIVAVADVNGEAAQALAARCGIPKVVASAEEVIGDPKVEAVLICSPTGTHADLIVQAAQGRQADLLREADCVQPGQDRRGAGGGGEGGRDSCRSGSTGASTRTSRACARRWRRARSESRA